ncbi:hypothetical protein B0J17DRAFT_222874 [Rhizoctonia solani]|nr:hypothetical protein B0J17DRAFT_222874 [Rhizoctonia solani]
MTQALENKKKRDELFCLREYSVGATSNWTLGSVGNQWTYVIDFDNCVFTVNGAVHFPFDNIPPLLDSEYEPSFDQYIDSDERVEIPAKYLKAVDLWPAPRFEVARAR